MEHKHLTRLHQILATRFDLEELRTLCFHLGLDYDDLKGEGRIGKARELVTYFERRKRIAELITVGKQLRPDIAWDVDDAVIPPGNAGAPPFAANPFIQGGRITDPAHFFDRQDLLDQVFEELGKGSNLSLVGETQIGKSSLLEMIRARGPGRLRLPAESFAYLSLQLVENEDEFYQALCHELGIATCRGYALVRALHGRRIVLCLDELEVINDSGFTIKVRRQLRGLADGATAPLMLVTASRSPLAHLFPDSPELDSPLAGICRQVDVGPFPRAIARALLAERLRGTGMTFTEAQIAGLIEASGGHPARLQRAAAELYRALTQGRGA